MPKHPHWQNHRPVSSRLPPKRSEKKMLIAIFFFSLTEIHDFVVFGCF
jgi:hypothetical protein